MQQYKKWDFLSWSANSIDYKWKIKEVYTDDYTLTVDGEGRAGTANKETPTYLVWAEDGHDYIVDHLFINTPDKK